MAVISSAHLEGLIHKGCPFVLKLFRANVTECILSRCSYCSYITNIPEDMRSMVKEEGESHCIAGILDLKQSDNLDGTFFSICP